MNYLDYTIIAAYIIGMLVLGYYLKKQENSKDYFLGGKNFGWFSLTMSAMASQLSVISFVSAPAFVGLRVGGGMKWLTFELGVPIAMILVMTFIGPILYRSGVVSIYSFLEKRFGASTRLILSSVFLFSRSFAGAVTVYAVSLILASLLHLSFNMTLLIVGVSTIVYSFEGGMKAIVYSEVVQMIIKVTGIFIIVYFGLKNMGGWGELIKHVDQSRLHVIDFSNFGINGDEYGFFPMLLGGIFLYTSYYGTDQMQAQRIISAKDVPTLKNILLANGLLRFPITLSYCIGGLILGTFALQNQHFMSLIPAGKTDLMIPIFIEHYLPNGVIGVLVVAIIAAAMSAYSSILNSLSAVSMEEIISKRNGFDDSKYVFYSKLTTVIWGAATLGFSFFVGSIAKTVIEAINKIGSVFYGPMLATFLVAVLISRVNGKAMNIGLLAGVLVNMFLWIFVPQIFWFWWNIVGAFVTIIVALLASMVYVSTDQKSEIFKVKLEIDKRNILILLLFFIFIIILCLNLSNLFQ
ncbi:Na+/solute symporter (plasmid) [Emticicia oligotrophica DSM 17448]|uniref:Na+/solute symporter n=1 Tax=Emticicia oligotrophica (strain DSM 17448 / CIP 109782 / MTCC 6937 / GPTSA100-15) TaxID=929562 RepID=A0ABM5N8D2_EMTOG|nr:sodium transporter [Emticicia oligotrophica]AFK05730.1 Na+/solute symporter [Emticicia oligotrophica DSM 17448]